MDQRGSAFHADPRARLGVAAASTTTSRLRSQWSPRCRAGGSSGDHVGRRGPDSRSTAKRRAGVRACASGRCGSSPRLLDCVPFYDSPSGKVAPWPPNSMVPEIALHRSAAVPLALCRSERPRLAVSAVAIETCSAPPAGAAAIRYPRPSDLDDPQPKQHPSNPTKHRAAPSSTYTHQDITTTRQTATKHPTTRARPNHNRSAIGTTEPTAPPLIAGPHSGQPTQRQGPRCRLRWWRQFGEQSGYGRGTGLVAERALGEDLTSYR